MEMYLHFIKSDTMMVDFVCRNNSNKDSVSVLRIVLGNINEVI